MQKEHFVSLGSCILEGSEPEVTGDGGKLLRERENI